MNTDPHTAPPLLSVDEARDTIDRWIQPVTETETVPLEQALGRVLAEPVTASMNIPPYRNSAMDGYAVNAQSLQDSDSEHTLAVTGTALAGRAWRDAVAPRQCVRIMTGAPLPEGTDAVVIQENVVRDGDRIRFQGPVPAGQNVREAGEDIADGATVFEPGRRLGAADLGVLASLGRASVRAVRPLRIRFFTSGDEVRAPGEPLDYGELYDSNRYVLTGLLQHPGFQADYGGNLPDDPDQVRQQLLDAAADADVILTCGGVSVGEADCITGVLDALGEIAFRKIAVKPGKPLNFGRLNNALFFGLPGNPVSAMVTFLVFVRPALHKRAGQDPVEAPLSVPAVLDAPIKKRPGRVEYQRGILSGTGGGTPRVRPAGPQGSHQLSSLSRANCLIVLDADCGGLSAGDTVAVLPLEAMR